MFSGMYTLGGTVSCGAICTRYLEAFFCSFLPRNAVMQWTRRLAMTRRVLKASMANNTCLEEAQSSSRAAYSK